MDLTIIPFIQQILSILEQIDCHIITITITILLSSIPFIVKIISDKTLEKYKKTSILKDNLFKEQMSAADKTMIDIKTILVKKYSSICSNERDIRAYSNILDYTLSETKKNKLKQYLKNNHLVTKSKYEFDQYKQKTIPSLISYHILLLNNNYLSSDFTINRDILSKENESIIRDISDNINSLLDELKEIALTYDKLIKELK